MYKLSILLVLSACSAPAISEVQSTTLTASGAGAGAVLSQLPRLAALADAPLIGTGLVESDAGALALSAIVGCALRSEAELDDTRSDGVVFQFFGEAGIAPRWIADAIDRRRSELVTGCLLAHLSRDGLPTVVSMRGPSLPAPTSERDALGMEEGAFFGDVFGRHPIVAACSGRWLEADPDSPALAHRDCARPAGSLTRCGLTYAGSCRAACEGPPARRRCRVDGRWFPAVTTFVAP